MFCLVFQCGKCEESFETAKQLQRHLRTHEPVPIPKFNSTNEGATGNTPKSSGSIIQKKTYKRIEYECYLCNHRYKGLGNMRRHMNLHTKSEKVVFHFCSICRAKVDRTKMDWHVCGQGDDVQCEYCSKRFTGTSKLLKHLDVMHKTKRRLYECEKCVKHFPTTFLKDCHQMTHANEPEEYSKLGKHKNAERPKEHLCEACGKTFTTGENTRQ